MTAAGQPHFEQRWNRGHNLQSVAAAEYGSIKRRTWALQRAMVAHTR